jgi:PAS domain S-box-containing protein
MDPLKAVLWGLCGASALSGGVSLLFSFRLKHPSLYRTHALMCLSIVVYLVCNIHLYSTASIDEYYTVSRVRMYGTALFHVALLLFAGEYTGVPLRRFTVPVSALFALFLAARHVFPPFLDSTVHGITLHPLPWGGHISMVDLAAGPLFIAYQALVISAYAVVFYAAALQYRVGQRRGAALLFAGVLTLFAALIHDTVVFNLSLSWPMISEAGFTGIILLVGVVISDELARSAALSETVAAGERRFQAIFNSTFQFIGLLDREGRILEVNQPALAFIGESHGRVRGHYLWESPWWNGLPDDGNEVREAVAAAAGGAFMRFSTRHVSKEGIVAHFDFSLKPIFDSGGQVELILAEGRDVSGLREAAETIARKNEELAAVNEELVASIEELEASNNAFEEQNRDLMEAQAELKLKEAELRRLIDNAPAVIYRQSLPDGVLTYIGGRCVDIFGLTARELLERQDIFDELLEFDWREYLRKAWYHIKRGIDPPTVDFGITQKSGEKRWLCQRSILIRGEHGEPLALEGIVYDITARRLAEEALQRSEYYLGSILRSTPDIIYRLDPQGTITYINEAVKKYGYEPARVIGTSLLDYVHPDDLDLARYRINERRTGSRATRFLELRIFTPRGGTVYFEYSASAIQATPVFLIHAEGLYNAPMPEPKAFIGTQGIARDITERKRAETALRESEQGLRAFIDQSFEGIVIIDEEGRVAEWNPVTERLSGIPRLEALGAAYWDVLYRLVPEERRTDGRRAELERMIRDALSTGVPIFSGPRLFENERTDGTRGYIEQVVFPIRTSKGFRFGSISHDVTDRFLLEKTLRESADRFRILIESSPIPVILARSGKVIFVNNAFRRLAMLEENEAVEGRNLLEFVAEERRAEVESYVRARLSGGEAPALYRSIGLRRDGSSFPYEISVVTVELPDGSATLAYVREVSDRS